ncbi:GrpB family protein [Pseudarthrobacter raffinosi]|uniref:GrpB family protein n=1 Tax=Pseudarthrobacter raffinosi TaxID=2953651 RepID=UPI0035ABC28D|nr:GrpB family protein [Pseudarthrobacter sp. MDT3-9]
MEHVGSTSVPELASKREPAWFEHRRFRDYLRSSQDARIEYEQLKRRLADQEWTFMQDYAEAKGSTIRALLAQYRVCVRNIGDRF